MSVKSRRAYRRQRDEFLVQQARDLAAAMNLHGQSEGPGPGREQEPQAATNVDGHRPGPGRRPEPQAGAADCGDCPETGQRDDARDHDTHGGAAERPGPGQQHEASDIIVHRGEASRPEPGREARALADMYAKVSLTACPGVPELKLVQKMADVPLNSRLKFNPNARFATPAQREELLRRDGYRCCVPGCPHHLWLEAHHLIEFCLGGLTGWKFLRMVCRSCHRNIHSGVLTVTLEKDGTLRFRDRKGRDLRRAIDMEVAQWLNFWQGWRGERVACHMRRVADGAWDERAEPAA